MPNCNEDSLHKRIYFKGGIPLFIRGFYLNIRIKIEYNNDKLEKSQS